jgi:hypothetical protein
MGFRSVLRVRGFCVMQYLAISTYILLISVTFISFEICQDTVQLNGIRILLFSGIERKKFPKKRTGTCHTYVGIME